MPMHITAPLVPAYASPRAAHYWFGYLVREALR